jgi:hypothetical protein
LRDEILIYKNKKTQDLESDFIGFYLKG